MADANKFATILLRNTNRITLILVYSVLEWILIALMLLNSLFSYLIAKFAFLFGLQSPCLWCSRIDHWLERRGNGSNYFDLICDMHVEEISKMRYCSNHQQIAAIENRCEECLASQLSQRKNGGQVAVFSLEKEKGTFISEGKLEIEDNEGSRCSCCDVSLNGRLLSQYVLFKPSRGVMDGKENENLIEKNEEEVNYDLHRENDEDALRNGDCFSMDKLAFAISPDKKEVEQRQGSSGPLVKEKEQIKKLRFERDLVSEEPEMLLEDNLDLLSSNVNAVKIQPLSKYDASIEIISSYMKDFSENDHVIPIELIDSTTEINHISGSVRNEECITQEFCRSQFTEEDDGNCGTEKKHKLKLNDIIEEDSRFMEEDTCIILRSVHSKEESICVELGQTVIAHKNPGVADVDGETQTDGKAAMAYNNLQDFEESGKIVDPDYESHGSEKRDYDSKTADPLESPENVYPLLAPSIAADEEMKTPLEWVAEQCEFTSKMAIENGETTVNEIVKESSSKLYQDTDEKTSDIYFITDSAVENRKLITELLDGIGVDSSDSEVLTTDDLKLALDAERRARNSLNAQLEEERDASIVAANRAEASIAKLHEERAVLEMEALRYRKIIEEKYGKENQKQKSEMITEGEIVVESGQGVQHYSLPCLEVNMGDRDTVKVKEPQSCSVKKLAEISEMDLDIASTLENGQVPNPKASLGSETNDLEEEREPEIPSFMERIHALTKSIYDRREFGTESLDGSEIDSCEIITIERLKADLNAERKALGALYAELEEERSASAIAANQTMAMITRLQEEKAAVQMEALQYQRMMEEQAEYDQEALQLLNELMIKREKEKQELEKEVELYRKKVILYELEKKRMKKRTDNDWTRTSSSSSSSSSSEDSDEKNSMGMNEGDDSVYGLQENSQNRNTASDIVTNLEHENKKQSRTLHKSLDDFEEERLSILEQLKALEEKLFSLDEEEEQFSMKPMKPISEEEEKKDDDKYDENSEMCTAETTGLVNGVSVNDRRTIGSSARGLLPLFDAVSLENEDKIQQRDRSNGGNNYSNRLTTEQRVAFEEEMELVYARLQALEADREFLSHSIISLKKGDKGMDLLQEILQDLRDMRNMELQPRSPKESFQ